MRARFLDDSQPGAYRFDADVQPAGSRPSDFASRAPSWQSTAFTASTDELSASADLFANG
jgi:hypothetical protein